MPFAAKKNMYQSDSEMFWFFIWWLCNKKNIYDMVAWGYDSFPRFHRWMSGLFSTFENKILYLCMALQYPLLFLKILLIIL